MSSAASQARWMFRMAASCLVKSVANPAGLAAYSSRARATQRSMVAALLISTSSAIHASPLPDVCQEPGTGAVELGLFAQHGGLEQVSLHVASPPALASGDDLVLHHGGCRAQVQQVHWAACHFLQIAGQLPHPMRVCIPCHEHGQVQIAVGSSGALDAAAEGKRASMPGKRPAACGGWHRGSRHKTCLSIFHGLKTAPATQAGRACSFVPAA